MSAAGEHRLPPRRTGLRLWTMRLVGLLATAALLAVGATAVLTFMPDRAEEAALVDEAPAATASGGEKASEKPKKPRYTAAQRRQRRAAVRVLREQGYRPVRLADYRPGKRLRVMIGRGDAGQRAFFFAGGRFIGNDAAEDSERVRVHRAGDRSVTLTYQLYREDDKPCCPKAGVARVRFRWDGEQLAPQSAIPPGSSRRAPAF